MKPLLFDTHAHLDNDRFQEDFDTIIENIQANMELVMNVGYDLQSSKNSISLAETYDFIYAAVGIHPHDAKDATDHFWNELKQMVHHPKVKAIGEIGLDYYYDYSPRDVQQQVFAQQINFAKDVHLPIIIHDRDAHQDTLDILKAENARDVGGVFHAYSGSWEMAKIVLDMNFYISLGGPLTFKNANKLLEVAEKAPLDRLLIETDCPYLTPHPFRGKRNEPMYVRYVAEKIAELKGISYDEVARATLENGKKAFGIF